MLTSDYDEAKLKIDELSEFFQLVPASIGGPLGGVSRFEGIISDMRKYRLAMAAEHVETSKETCINVFGAVRGGIKAAAELSTFLNKTHTSTFTREEHAAQTKRLLKPKSASAAATVACFAAEKEFLVYQAKCKQLGTEMDAAVVGNSNSCSHNFRILAFSQVLARDLKLGESREKLSQQLSTGKQFKQFKDGGLQGCASPGPAAVASTPPVTPPKRRQRARGRASGGEPSPAGSAGSAHRAHRAEPLLHMGAGHDVPALEPGHAVSRHSDAGAVLDATASHTPPQQQQSLQPQRTLSTPDPVDAATRVAECLMFAIIRAGSSRKVASSAATGLLRQVLEGRDGPAELELAARMALIEPAIAAQVQVAACGSAPRDARQLISSDAHALHVYAKHV